jgi:FixJ family two-component response regulator
MSQAAPRVFVVDDDPVVLRGLKRLLDFAGFRTETFQAADEFLRRLEPNVSGCVILDLAMPELNGLEVQRVLTSRGSLMPVIFLTGHADVASSVQAMKRGAVDFLEKPVSQQALLGAVAHAMQQCESLQRQHEEITDAQKRYATLTSREREVFAHLLAGQLNKQIAADLGTMISTVKAHRAHVMRKMGARTIAALIQLAAHGGIKPSVHPPIR